MHYFLYKKVLVSNTSFNLEEWGFNQTDLSKLNGKQPAIFCYFSDGFVSGNMCKSNIRGTTYKNGGIRVENELGQTERQQFCITERKKIAYHLLYHIVSHIVMHLEATSANKMCIGSLMKWLPWPNSCTQASHHHAQCQASAVVV